MNQSRNEKLLYQLLQMKHRLRGEHALPDPNQCKDTQCHIAGLFLKMHIDELIELVKDAT